METFLNLTIGLASVYLSYSLLATLLLEVISTNLGLRARNLKQAIVRLLNDETLDRQNGISELLTANWESLKRLIKPDPLQGWAKEFYNSPGIKYLAANRFFSKPSAISPDAFADNLIYILDQEGQGITRQERIQNLLFRTAIPKTIEPVKSDSSENEPECQCGLVVHDTSSETRAYLSYLFSTSQNDISKFRLHLIKWFDEVMERATGWYKKKMQVWLFFIGFAIATTFNVDTFLIVQRLAVNPAISSQLSTIVTNHNLNEIQQLDGETDENRVNEELQRFYTVAHQTQGILSIDQPVSINSIPGLLITALAISLGSTFWFDLLNKVMRLRVSSKPAPRAKPSSSQHIPEPPIG